MHPVKLSSLSAVGIILLLTPASFAKPTPSPGSAYNVQSNNLSIREKGLPASVTADISRRWPAISVPPSSDSEQSRSLMTFPKRDTSQLQASYTTLEEYVAFDPTTITKAIPVLNGMFAQIHAMSTQKHRGRQLEQAWQFIHYTYGAFRLTIRAVNGLIPLDVINEVVEYINETIVGGMVGFFRANFLTIAGVAIVASYTLIIGAILFLGHLPLPGDDVVQDLAIFAG